MKRTLTCKYPLENLTNGRSYGLIYYNLWSENEISPALVLEEVMKPIKTAPGKVNNSLDKMVDNLKGITPLYWKVNHNINGYYYQIVADVRELEQEFSYTGYNSVIHYLKRYSESGSGVYIDREVKILGSISEYLSNGDVSTIYVGNNSENISSLIRVLNKHILDEASIIIDTVYPNDKKYNMGMSVKVEITITDTLTEALELKSSKTISILLGDTSSLIFKRLETRNCSEYIYKLVYNNKIKAKVISGKIVFYDGEKALETIVPYIPTLDDDILFIDITQYSANKDLYFQTRKNNNIADIKKIVLNFIDKKYLDLNRCNIDCDDCRINGGVNSIIRSNGKTIKRQINLRVMEESSFYAQLIIPVKNNEVKQEDIERIIFLLNEPFKERRDYDKFYEEARKYFLSLRDEIEGNREDDVLSKWFKMCTAASSAEDRNIIQAYTRMKNQLLNEYTTLQTYVNHYDFSKCTPVPKIKIDNKMGKIMSKTLQIEPKNIIINSVNQKRIKEIREIQPTATVMIKYKGMFYNQDYPLSKFYNPILNTLELNYKEMRGAVLNDKAKNRR